MEDVIEVGSWVRTAYGDGDGIVSSVNGDNVWVCLAGAGLRRINRVNLDRIDAPVPQNFSRRDAIAVEMAKEYIFSGAYDHDAVASECYSIADALVAASKATQP